MQWIVDHQFAKRNLPLSEKIRLSKVVMAQMAKEAEQRMRSGVKQTDPTVNLPQGISEKHADGFAKNLPQTTSEQEPKRRNPTTAEQMAKKLHMSDKTFRDANFVFDHGTQRQIERMDKGGRNDYKTEYFYHVVYKVE